MNELTSAPQVKEQKNLRTKIVRTVANIVIGIIGLSTGAAIVHGMVIQQCSSKVQTDGFIAGVLPPGMQMPAPQNNNQPVDIQKCVNEGNDFEAGVLPADEGSSQTPADASSENTGDQSPPQQPSVQGFTPIQQNPALTVVQTAAPAPAPAPSPTPVPVVQTQPVPTIISTNVAAVSTPIPKQPTQSQPAVQQTPQPAKPVIKKVSPPVSPPAPVKPAPAKTATPAKPLSVDLDKLSMAVAMTETHNCADTRGSALFNNCFGIKKNGQFMHFQTPQQSHDYFKQLWVNGYGGTFPSYRAAQIYSGNDHPTTWLKNVTYYYNKNL